MNTRLARLALTIPFVLAMACHYNPTAPFEGFNTEGSGVVLTGRIVGQSTAQALRAQTASADSITVVVFEDDGNGGRGPEVGRLEVDNGSFTLRGLPDGGFTVVFYLGGEEVGSLPFDNVLPNQEITIVVEVDDSKVENKVVLLDEKRTGIGHGDVELEGIARSIQVEGDPMTGSLEVNGQLVRTRAAETTIRKGNDRLTLEDLDSGSRVHVKGVWETASDGSEYVFAREIMLQEEVDSGDSQGVCSNLSGGRVGERIVLEGKVVSGDTHNFELDVNGNRANDTVDVSFGGTPTCVGNAKKKATCQVEAGDQVNVKGTLVDCTSVSADEVKIQK